MPGKTFVGENTQCSLGMAHSRRQPSGRSRTDEILKHLGAGANLVAFLFFRELGQLNVLGIGVADDLVAALMHRFHGFGISMDAKRVGIERCLHPVLVQDPQYAPHAGPATVIVLAGSAAIVERHDVVFLDRIRSADVMGAAMLGIGNFGPSFQISRQRDRHARAVGPLDFDLFRLRINIVKIIVLRHHNPPALLCKLPKYLLPLGYMEIATSCQSSSLDAAADAKSVPASSVRLKSLTELTLSLHRRMRDTKSITLLLFRVEARNLSRRYAVWRSLFEPLPDVEFPLQMPPTPLENREGCQKRMNLETAGI